MAARITLPGAGAIDLDTQEARILNVGLLDLTEAADYVDDVSATAEEVLNRSAINRQFVTERSLSPWDDTVAYTEGQYVVYQDGIWFATTTTTVGTPPSDTNTEWDQLSRDNLFIRFSDGSTEFTPDSTNDVVTVAGGTNITVTADAMMDSLTIDWAAALNDISNVDADNPTTGYYLQWDGTNWVPAEVAGDGFSSISDGTTTVTATPSIDRIDLTSTTAAVDVTVTQDSDSANVDITVANARGDTSPQGRQAGLMSGGDKTLLDSIEAGDYNNANLSLTYDDTTFVLRLLGQGNTELGVANLENLEDIGGKLWNSTTAYVRGDIVSVLVSGNYFTYFATQGSTGQDPTDENSMFWQQADILRVRDIENIDLPDDLADNSLLIWSQPDPTMEGEWVATNAANIVGMVTDLVDDADVERDGLGRVTGITVGAGPNPSPINRGLDRWQPMTAYDVGDTFYTDNDTTLFRTENRDHTYYVHTAIDNTHATLDLVSRQSITPLDVADPDIPPASGRGITVFGPTDQFGIDVYEINFTPQFQTGFPYQIGDVFTTTSDTTFYPPGFINVVCFVTQPIDSTHFTFSQTVQNSVQVLDDPYRGTWSGRAAYVEGDIVQYTVANPSTAPVADRLHFYISSGSIAAPATSTDPDNPNPETSDDWQRLTTRFGDGLLDTEGTLTVRTGAGLEIASGDVAVDADTTQFQFDATSGEMSLVNPFNPDLPISTWDTDADYVIGDQVLYVDDNSNPSIYISRTGTDATPNSGNQPVSDMGVADETNWNLIRSGITRLQTNGNSDTGGGLTANATLHINEGSGIQVDRNQTTFTITAHGTGHSDASQFAPGYRYSYYPLYGEVGLLTGVVSSTSFNQTIRFIRDDGADRVRIQWLSGLTGTPGADYGFVIQGRTNDSNSILNSNDDHIFYGFSSPTDNELFFITQTDPTVADVDALNSLLGIVPPAQISPNLNVEVFLLENDHPNPQYEPAVWARDGNTDDIPGNKLGALDDMKPDNKADGTALGTIDDSWISADIARDTEIRGQHWISGYTYAVGDLVTQDTFTYFCLADHTADDTNQPSASTRTTDSGTGNWKLLIDDRTIDETDDVISNTTAPSRHSVWTLVQDSMTAAGRLDFTMRDSLTYDATGFITDIMQPENVTTIRSAEFENNLFRVNLADESNLMSTISFARGTTAQTLNWDVPATLQNDTVNVVEDPVLLNRHYNILATTNAGEAGDFTITPASRDRNGTWNVVPTSQPLATPSGLNGGSIGATSFTASSDDGTVTSTTVALGMGVTWRNASLNNGNRNFGTARTFLQAYPSYSWTISTNNVTNNNSTVIQFSGAGGTTSFPNPGTTTVTGAGQTGTDITTLNTLSIGGEGNIVFTQTNDIWNRGSLSADLVNVNFVRPAAVTTSTTAETTANSISRNLFPNFQYPLFWVTTAEGAATPSAADFIGGTQIQAGTRVGTNARDNTQLGNMNISLASSTAVRTLWVAYPAALNAPISQTNTTTAPGNPSSTTTTSIPANDRSTASIEFLGTGAPQSAAENYNWFRLNIPAGVSYVLNSVSA